MRRSMHSQRSLLSTVGLPLPTGFSLMLALAVSFLMLLWIAGGATRSDVLGQMVVRFAAWSALCLAAIFAPRPALGKSWPVAAFLALALVLAIAQLVPLPPALWQSLPGRGLLVEAAAITGETQPWRPLSIVPDATANAAGSLVVPITMLALLSVMNEAERRWLPVVLLCLIVASALLGLLQFSGSRFNNPLINDTVGQISASFANRNHLALFLAIGCVLAPAWAVQDMRGRRWRMPAALGITLMFVLMVLATGSRAGILLCGFALVAALVLVWRDARRELRHYPRWMLPVVGAVVASAIAIAVFVAFVSNRATSISRLLASEEAQDMRGRALPTVIEMIQTYFPAGSGLGAFDPVFRIHEPQNLLKLTYFNHAHNDFLEVALDTGLPGLALMLAAIVWWGVATFRAWRGIGAAMLPRLGSVILALIMVASVVDYPARTPMIMAVLIVAAWWLSQSVPRKANALRN